MERIREILSRGASVKEHGLLFVNCGDREWLLLDQALSVIHEIAPEWIDVIHLAHHSGATFCIEVGAVRKNLRRSQLCDEPTVPIK